MTMNMKKYLPTRQQLRETKSLRFLGDRIFDKNLWRFNRHSLSYAVLVGTFFCFMPMLFQSIPAIMLCIWLRCNVPVTIAVIWVSNPITMPPMMYFAYRVGQWLLGKDSTPRPDNFTLESFLSQISELWQPLLLGCVVCGAFFGIIGFVGVRLYFRWRAVAYLRRKNKPHKD